MITKRGMPLRYSAMLRPCGIITIQYLEAQPYNPNFNSIFRALVSLILPFILASTYLPASLDKPIAGTMKEFAPRIIDSENRSMAANLPSCNCTQRHYMRLYVQFIHCLAPYWAVMKTMTWYSFLGFRITAIKHRFQR